MTVVKIPWGAGTLDFTPARRRAFDVLVEANRANRPAAVSNRTDPNGRFVYWQAADWLVETGLARTSAPSIALRLTIGGWMVAHRLAEAER